MSGRFILFLSVGAAIWVLAGCTPKIQKPTEICPGKRTTNEALTALQSNSQNMVPFRAGGYCYFEYYPEGQTKPKSENLGIEQFWVDPPLNIFLQGGKTGFPKAMILGSNDKEFWLAIRPKDSLYVWGRWSEQDSSEGPTINPKTLLEALGIGEIDTDQDWSLSNKGPYDILTKHERGAIAKKIYIFNCDYRVRKIEFFGSNGKVAAVAELDKYEQVSEGFFIPSLIKATTYNQGDRKKPFTFTLSLEYIRPTKISEPQRKYLFTRRPSEGFKHVGRIVNGKWIDESE